MTDTPKTYCVSACNKEDCPKNVSNAVTGEVCFVARLGETEDCPFSAKYRELHSRSDGMYCGDTCANAVCPMNRANAPDFRTYTVTPMRNSDICILNVKEDKA